MSLASRQKSYKALTHINLPFTEVRKAPGDEIKIQELIDAKQSDEDVDALIAVGALGEAKDEIHPDNIIPDPAVPTIQIVVSQAQAMVAQMEAEGEKIPPELKAIAELDYHHAVSADRGVSHESAG